MSLGSLHYNAYEHAWKYVMLAKRTGREQLWECLTSYSDRYASMLANAGVIPLFSFLASRAGKVLSLLGQTGPDGIDLKSLERYLEDDASGKVAHAMIFDCYARWLIKRLKIMDEAEYCCGPLGILRALIEKTRDVGYTELVLSELSKVAIALKYLAAGEFES